MSPKRRRMWFVIGSLCIASIAMACILTTFRDQLIFFYTPSQWLEKSASAGASSGRPLRIGGLVKEGSVAHELPDGLRFVITDLTHDVTVRYRGTVPALFREGQGVVAQGTIDRDGVMQASTILAKHDENYMPREVVEQLKKSGQWQEYRR